MFEEELDLKKLEAVMSDLKMDDVDQKQQREIDSQRTWMKVMGVLVTLLTLTGIALFVTLMESVGCPHEDCPHYRGPIQQVEEPAADER